MSSPGMAYCWMAGGLPLIDPRTCECHLIVIRLEAPDEGLAKMAEFISKARG